MRCGAGEFMASEEAVDLHDALMLAAEKVEEQAKRARKREVDHRAAGTASRGAAPSSGRSRS